IYLAGEMSDDARRAFKRMLQPVVDGFFKEVEKGKLYGFVYTDMPDNLPLTLPYRHASASIEEHPVNEVLAQLGFKADLGSQGKDQRNAAVRSLIYFLEAYFDKSNSEINQKLRRRLHWLTV